MSGFWSSLSSPATLNAYLSTAYNNFKANGQLPASDWNCSFGEPDWQACFFQSAATPIMLAVMFGSMGLFVQAMQHWGFYATIGARETDDAFVTGIHLVYPGWYVLDAQFGAFFTFFEMIFISTSILILGFNITRFNYNSFTDLYFIIGLIQTMVGYIYVSNGAIIMAYNVFNATYLQSRYPIDKLVAIEFPTFFNQFDGKDDTLLSVTTFIEQLIIGNKRLSLYSNTLAAIAMLFHPISAPFSMYFWMQLPAQFILDVMVYPFFPQFDTPQFPWYEYFN